MAKKRLQTLLPFALIAIVIAITLIFALRTPSARSEESTYDPGPYGIPQEQIDEARKDLPSFLTCKPAVPARYLPPMPPLPGSTLASSSASLPCGSPPQCAMPTRAISVEMGMIIESLAHRRTPWSNN